MFGFTFQLMALEMIHLEGFVLLFSWEAPDGIFCQAISWFLQDPWDGEIHPSSHVAGGRKVVSCGDSMPQGEDPREVLFQDLLVLGGGILLIVSIVLVEI